MNSPFNNNKEKNGKFSETVIIDNKFHQQLSNVRNRDAMDNHPDIELMKKEQQQASQRHLATLYRMPAIKDTSGDKPSAPAPLPQPDLAMTVRTRPQSAVVTFHDCMRALELEAKRCVKFSRPFSLAIVGFGDLARVVSSYGVPAYDQSLAFIDSVLCNVVDTDIDTVGHYSNDRFMVLLPECNGPNSTMFAETARQYFEGCPIQHQGHLFFLRASIGIACFPNHGADWKVLLAKADLACESILDRGGNAFGFASV
ncbi:MAG: diguanylate cyclase [Candidatus Obscuribacterales bacterium]|nr:diguanylate cyclase [Candidatus Obscuribacterales bacterium]